MTRLIHTTEGGIRAMQISKYQVFAYVEGGLDRPFVERLLRLYAKADTKIRVIAIKETQPGTGGKFALLEHFRELKNKGQLFATAWGKTFVNLFFLDKDADDVLKKQIKSKHVAYTSTYDLEGSLFAYGNLYHALADTCLITREQSRTMIGDANKLLHDVPSHWSDWITLCLVSQYKKKNIGCTFDRVSLINTDPFLPPDSALLEQWRNKVRDDLDLTEVEFNRLYLRFNRNVRESIATGNPLRFFKGKWFKFILQKKRDSVPKIPDANINAAGDRVLSVLVSHVASHSACQLCQHYESFVREALEMVETCVDS